jgi:hypothetical protein
MRKSFGMVMLVVVMAVVLLLVAQAWSRLAPAAVDVHKATTGQIMHDHGQTEAAEALRAGHLPRLEDAQARTDVHAEDVKQALESGE